MPPTSGLRSKQECVLHRLEHPSLKCDSVGLLRQFLAARANCCSSCSFTLLRHSVLRHGPRARPSRRHTQGSVFCVCSSSEALDRGGWCSLLESIALPWPCRKAVLSELEGKQSHRSLLLKPFMLWGGRPTLGWSPTCSLELTLECKQAQCPVSSHAYLFNCTEESEGGPLA